jgi:hypothetical protein
LRDTSFFQNSTEENRYYSNFQKGQEYSLGAMNGQMMAQPMTIPVHQTQWGGPSLQQNSLINVSNVEPQFDAWAPGFSQTNQARMVENGNGNGNVAVGKQPSR